MARGGAVMEDAFLGRAVDGGHHLGPEGARLLRLARRKEGAELLDRRAQVRSVAAVHFRLPLGLSKFLLRGLRSGHGFLKETIDDGRREVKGIPKVSRLETSEKLPQVENLCHPKIPVS